jgi:hypothetical protein
MMHVGASSFYEEVPRRSFALGRFGYWASDAEWMTIFDR